MKHATHCKFCQKPITLTIDDSYAELGDPLKLIGLAACNDCADVRVERRKLEAKIWLACEVVIRAGKMEGEERARHSEKLTKLTQDYAKMIARWHKKEGMVWDEALVDTIMEHPNQWGEFLSKLWAMFRQWQAAQDRENEAQLL